ncbi:MAG: ABC transporter substrate-binding protein [Firmicutes bacterium]|nr:ABC transporter substrate-binding protein [Bacillota bacterium]
MKKVLTVILLLIFAVLPAATSLTGCGNASNAKEIIIKVPNSCTINSLTHPDIKNVKTLLTSASEEYTAQSNKNVKISVMEFNSGMEKEAITNTFGTDSAADVLFDGFFNMSSFIHTGNAVPLDDVLPQDAMSDLDSAYTSKGSFNNKMYMLPYTASQNIFIYNKNLLRSCGLDGYFDDGATISDWSIEQWTTILDTLANKLPDGNVPFMMYAKNNQGDTHIMTLLRSYGSELFDADNNFELVNDPKVIDALTWIQQGVKKDWYFPVPYDKTMTDNDSKFNLGELAFYIFNLNGSLYQKVKDDFNDNQKFDEYGFVNYPGNNCTLFCEGFEVFDNGDDEKIAIAKDFLRYFYTTDKWLECSAGTIPASRKVMEKYKDDILLLEAFSENAVHAVDFTRNLPNWQGSDDSVRSVFYQEIAKLLHMNDGRFDYTPEQIAASLQEKLNAAITNGRKNSRPHS